MTPQERNANIIGWTLIAVAILWILPYLPLMASALSEGSKQFWHDFQEVHRK